MSAQSVGLDQLIRSSFRELSSQLRVCMPARVESYDPDTHLASVQPLLKRRFFARQATVDLPIINRVPVIHPRTASAIIRLPVARGDIVTLVFADRSIESWLAGDGSAREPNDVRQHHLTDAYAFLGGYPEGKSVKAKNPNALEIVVAPGTKITIGNGTDEFLKVATDAFTSLSDLCDQLSQALTNIALITVNTSGVTSTVPLNAAIFVTEKAAVDAIKTAVQAEITKMGNLKV